MLKPNSEREKKFCSLFTEGHNATQAAIKAGFSEATASQQGYALKRKYEEFIAASVIGGLRDSGAEAMDVLKYLAANAKQESVRLKAATTLLTYGGFKPVEKQEIVIEDRSEKEIDAALQHILGDKAEAVLRKLN